MNEYDTELIRTILTKDNFAFVNSESEADVVMLNTCSVREGANLKIYNRIHEIKRAVKGHEVLVGILGCMATNFRQELLKNPRLAIDFIAGPDSYKKLPDLIREASLTGEKQFDVTLSEFETYSDVFPNNREGVNAWIAVMRGCDNFCTFCVVPYTRGRERSRPPENVVAEVRMLAEEGFKQVTFLGQNVNSYKYEGTDFADLLDAASRVDGIERIRFTSPHPKDFPDKLLKLIAENPRLCKHIHLPLQAGHNRILEMMNRTYTQEEFLGLVDKIRQLMPQAALTTDVIVGFPTETDEEFEATLKVMKTVRFDAAFMFKYSQRPMTAAAKKFPDDVSEEKKTERIVRLNEIQRQISLERNREQIGKIEEILIEGITPKTDLEFQGRSDGNKLVIVPTEGLKRNTLVKVQITEASTSVLKGKIISNQPMLNPRSQGKALHT